MAIFHLHVKNISRGNGRSVVAAAAYRAGETLPNEAEERESAFGGRRDVLHAEIRAPAEAPAWMSERARLWNAVEAAEIRKDARLAKEIEVALPREMARAQWLGLVRTFADAYVAEGFVVDLAIHDDGTARNPHAHLLLTTRIISEAGFGGKKRDADGKKFVLDARKLWAKVTNTTFASGGSGLAIDHRSHADAGSDTPPGRHRGPDPRARRLKRALMSTDRITEAREELLAPVPVADATFDPPVPQEAPTTVQAELKETGWRAEKKDIVYGKEEVEVAADLRELWQPMADHELPVPDPDGNLIRQEDRDRAEDAMLEEMHRQPPARNNWFQRGPQAGEKALPVERAEAAPQQKSWFVKRGRPAGDEPVEVDRVHERDRGQS